MAKSNVQKIEEDWANKKWRPMMAWAYILICLFDFIIAPILWSMLQASYKGNITEAWTPLTLQGAGLFHLSMGAILGVTAWSRGQEKLMGATNSPYHPNQRYTPPQRQNYVERDFRDGEDYPEK